MKARIAWKALAVEWGRLALILVCGIAALASIVAWWIEKARTNSGEALMEGLWPNTVEEISNTAVAAALGSGSPGDRKVFALGSSQQLALRYIPAGNFIMGGSARRGAIPHAVTLSKPYWMGETEVTQGQWQAVVGGNIAYFKGDPALPVEDLSWDEAMLFVRALNTRVPLPGGGCWVLPTEAQWEYACRAGTTGDFAGDLDAMAWYKKNSGDRTHPVATKPANAWGLYDMQGNVSEWCADWFADYPPGAASNPSGPANGSRRVYRGGSWWYDGNTSYASLCSYDRFGDPPGYRKIDLGFRVAAMPADVRSPAETKGSAPSEPNAGDRRTVDLGSGNTMAFCGIPAGSFIMGNAVEGEGLKHDVTLTKSFWLGKTEVTQLQWQAVMESNPGNSQDDPALPVEQVSWDDAAAFCGKLNAKGLPPAGWKFALPTEAQWEYACRAGRTGDHAGDLDAMVWYNKNSEAKTHPVATKLANAWGLHDMHGNVSEWCADWHANYPIGPLIDPSGPADGRKYVFRGGSSDAYDYACSSSRRESFDPYSRNRFLGFRVALVPAGP